MQVNSQQSQPVRVVIVDDTRTVRAMIKNMLESSPQIQVVGEAGDPYEARELIRRLNPDVITLDVVMPRMNGLDFLQKLMALRPMPVVMVSTRTTEKSREAITALSLGAVDCVDLGMLRRGQSALNLAETVLMAASSNVSLGTRLVANAQEAPTARPMAWNGKVVVIGSSTGGVDALLRVIGDYPKDGPPTVIAQHMPESFLESFAARLEKNCAPRVRLATNGARLEQGHVLLAPGGVMQTRIGLSDRLKVENVASDGSELYVPSVNQLFSSAEAHGEHVVGVMLTGMGRDGAKAMQRMRQAGAHTIVQDSETAVVDGMPRAARECGAAIEIAPLTQIGARILASTTRSPRQERRG